MTLEVGPAAVRRRARRPDGRLQGSASAGARPAPETVDEAGAIRQRARADAAKGIRRMAPTSLSEAERAVYLQSFDDAKEAEDK